MKFINYSCGRSKPVTAHDVTRGQPWKPINTLAQEYNTGPPKHDSTTIISANHIRWFPGTTAWHVLRLRMEGRPPDKEGSCEYIE
jgi:hypothetical protein